MDRQTENNQQKPMAAHPRDGVTPDHFSGGQSEALTLPSSRDSASTAV